MKQYLDLVRHVLEVGTRKENRTGVDTLSTFGYYFEHDLRDGFPLLTTKRVDFKNIVIELLWFLSGSDKSDFLERHGCKFWRPWYNEDGTVKNCYGPAWRSFPTQQVGSLSVGRAPFVDGVTPAEREFVTVQGALIPDFNDQIAWVLAELKRNPMSRRMVVSAWAPGVAQTAPLPPCHCMFVLNVQNEEEPVEKLLARCTPEQIGRLGISQEVMRNLLEKCGGTPEGRQEIRRAALASGVPSLNNQRLCLHLTQRSVDTLIGAPYNIASYALLLHLFSRLSGIEPGIFGYSLIDAHIYTAKPDGTQAEYDHVPGAREQLTREPRSLPTLTISDDITGLSDVERLLHPSVSIDEITGKFTLDGYDPHPALHFKVAV